MNTMLLSFPVHVKLSYRIVSYRMLIVWSSSIATVFSVYSESEVIHVV